MGRDLRIAYRLFRGHFTENAAPIAIYKPSAPRLGLDQMFTGSAACRVYTAKDRFARTDREFSRFQNALRGNCPITTLGVVPKKSMRTVRSRAAHGGTNEANDATLKMMGQSRLKY